jgi:hypothetical protein
MSFSDPSIHDVESIKASADLVAGSAHIDIKFTQSASRAVIFGENRGEITIFGDAGMLFKFRRLEAAINEIFGEKENPNEI